jgi:hypothetical protein
VFNFDGKFISETGKRGQGPGEFLTITAFYIEDNSVVIIDDMKSSFHRYDFNGKYLSSEKIEGKNVRTVYRAMSTDNDKLLMYHYINYEADMACSLINLENNELIGSYFSYSPLKVINFRYSWSSHPMTKTVEGIDFIMPLCDTVYCYNGSSFFPGYVVETPCKMMSRNQVKENATFLNPEVIDLARQGFFTGFYSIFETDRHIYLEFHDQGMIGGYFLCDKESRQGNYYHMTIDEKSNQIPFCDIKASFDDTFVGVFQPDLLLRHNFEIAGETGVQYKKMLSSLREDDNPILCLYKLKK